MQQGIAPLPLYGHPPIGNNRAAEARRRLGADMPVRPEEPTDRLFGNDDDDEGDLWEAIRDYGRLVGRQEWDSGGPGAGAGTVDVYFYRGTFYSDNDVEAY